MIQKIERFVARTIHLINPKHFSKMDYGSLHNWGIDDVIDGKLWFYVDNNKNK